MNRVAVINRMRANIDKCLDFNIIGLAPHGFALVPVQQKYGFRIVDVNDPGVGFNPCYVVAKGQEVYNVYPDNANEIIRGPYVCPENNAPNNVQMMGGKRRSRKQKRGRKGKSRRIRH